MSGKRPDQHNVDAGEAGSGDTEDRREDRSAAEQLPDEQKRHRARGGMSDDERVDEASEESFPASDPPAQP